MGVEVMIYIYGAICVSMIAFNVGYAMVLRGSGPRQAHRTLLFRHQIQSQLERLAQGRAIEERHLYVLQKKLAHVGQLSAYEQALHDLAELRKGPLFQQYLVQIQPVMLHLALRYRNREMTQAAYFSYFLSRYMLPKHLPMQALQEVLLHSYMPKHNLYCQVNVLQALCAFGSEESVLEALLIQDRDALFLHEKILTECLLSYTGDHHQLISLLLERREGFSVHTQLAILNYIRFCTPGYASQMFDLMEDTSLDKELRLAAIRYFGRYPYPPALGPLLRFAQDRDPMAWEYATVSASCLARYRGEEVVEALKQALHSSNWYVRYAAASSLEAQGMGYEDLLDIMAGNDRYAREMMMYRLESGRLQKAGV